MPMIFLDHQSSTPVLPEAMEAMMPFFTEKFGNPSSLHRYGLRAREALAQARAQIAGLIAAASPEEIIFTSGGTEAVNLAVKGAAWANQARGKHIVTSAIEHPAVLNALVFLEGQGFEVTRVPVDGQGFIDPQAVRDAMTDQTILVCVHHANHDVGTIQPLHLITQAADERGVPVFVDAVSSAGWLPLDVQAMGISLLALTAHRFYGPKGAGALYRQRRVRLTSLLHGGDQEQGRRSGTENVPAVVGAGVAAEIAARDLATRTKHTGTLQFRLWEAIRAKVPHVALHGPEPGPRRISTALNVSAEFTEGEAQLLSLDMAGIAVASGTSCVSRAIKVSHVLAAMGVERSVAVASVLFSLGKDSTEAEVDQAANLYARVIDRLRSMSPTWDEFQKGLLASRLAGVTDATSASGSELPPGAP